MGRLVLNSGEMGTVLDVVMLGGMILATVSFALLGVRSSPDRTRRTEPIENAG